MTQLWNPTLNTQFDLVLGDYARMSKEQATQNAIFVPSICVATSYFMVGDLNIVMHAAVFVATKDIQPFEQQMFDYADDKSQYVN